MNKYLKTILATGAVGILAVIGVAPAQASSASLAQRTTECSDTQVSTVKQTSSIKEMATIGTAVRATSASNDCALDQSVLVLGPEEVATTAMIKADPSLTSSQKTELLAAAAAGSVQSKKYNQFTTGGLYTVTQNGRFYYNGSKVWVKTTYLGYTGSQDCFINYSTVSLTNFACTESGSTAVRYMRFGWTVGIGAASYGVSMTANLYKNGTATGFAVTTG